MVLNIPNWLEYQQRTASGKPRPLLVEAVSHISEKNAALDMGAGALNEAQFLLSSGFTEVIAVDITPQFKEMVISNGSTFVYEEKPFEQYEFPTDYFDLISAQYSLPFVSEDVFLVVWKHIYASLKKGAVFTGQFFGPRDDWSARKDMNFTTADEVQKLISGFEVIARREQEYTEEVARKKHWHYFDLILKKPVH